MTERRLSGSFVALPTPFSDGGGSLDLEVLRALVRWHGKHATAGVVPAGTTGEAATLTDDEYTRVLETCVASAGGGSPTRLPVVAGVGTNCTRTSVERTKLATRLGVDAVLAVTPYYTRPSPRGLYLHFAAIAEATPRDVVLYNVPSRTGSDLTPDVVRALVQRYDNVVAIKQAAPSVDRVRELAAIEGLSVLCGEDALLADFVHAGATGSIGVVANLLPDEVAGWIDAARTGDEAGERRLAERILPIAEALFVESNPVPVKAALAALGRCTDAVRLPLAPLEPPSLDAVLAALDRASLADGTLRDAATSA